jgi:hypothetical protein
MITWSYTESSSSVYLQILSPPAAVQALGRGRTRPAVWQGRTLPQHRVRIVRLQVQVLCHPDRRPWLNNLHHRTLLSTERDLKRSAQVDQASVLSRIIREDYQRGGSEGRIIWAGPTTWIITQDQQPGTDHQRIIMNETNDQPWRQICRWREEHIRTECYRRIGLAQTHQVYLINKGARQATPMPCR